jgi:SAM-dependent methyltransferase
MDEIDLLIDLHIRNDRQGPGGEDETRQAIALARLDRREHLRVADIGCGTGASTLVLAKVLDAHVTAIDAAPAFVERLQGRAEQEGLGDRIKARVGHMESLPFADGEFDVIWSESAIYNMGFETGIRAWRRFLRPGGVLVVSELTWATSSRPADVETHWTTEYPGITTASANIRMLEQSGYLPLGFFFIPPHCWVENYYGPLRAAFPGFLERHEDHGEARRIVASEESEMRLYEISGRWYGYAFYVARRSDASDGIVAF